MSALETWDIGHPTHVALIGADAAFWALVPKDRVDDRELRAAYRDEEAALLREMETLRFHLQPSCVYFNPTERCNLNCTYCYIPEGMRRSGRHMSGPEVLAALAKLDDELSPKMANGQRPQIIFHGAEPLTNRDAVFAAIERYESRFRFGVQTNATLLDDEVIAFLTRHKVGIGLSLDGAVAEVADRTRPTWGGVGTHAAVVEALGKLRGYPAYNVICTITTENVAHLSAMVDFLHAEEVPACMLNVIRCALPGAERVRADDAEAARFYLAALDRSHELYRKTGRKLVVANFANTLLAILAPTARRLMCDISPCGGGRSFFALAPNGDLFPCSEFIGLPDFCGGNLFKDALDDVLKSAPFRAVTGRKVEDIEKCRDCAIRHFCGAPCPAEAHERHGGMDKIGGYCLFYEEQARYAFRLIADGKEDDYLWDGWAEGTRVTFGRVAGGELARSAAG